MNKIKGYIMKKSKGHLLCDAIINSSKITETTKFNGIKKIRDVLKWLNNRDESLNKDKSILTLIDEFNHRKRILK